MVRYHVLDVLQEKITGTWAEPVVIYAPRAHTSLQQDQKSAVDVLKVFTSLLKRKLLPVSGAKLGISRIGLSLLDVIIVQLDITSRNLYQISATDAPAAILVKLLGVQFAATCVHLANSLRLMQPRALDAQQVNIEQEILRANRHSNAQTVQKEATKIKWDRASARLVELANFQTQLEV